MEGIIYVAAKGIAWDGQRALILQRGDEENGAGSWEFPGGGMLFGEQPQECLVREFFEETGLEVRPLRLLYASSFQSAPTRQIVLLTYLCRAEGHQVRLSREHKDSLWADIIQMQQLLEPGIAAELAKHKIYRLLRQTRA